MSLQEKIFIKQYTIQLNKNKRLHFKVPNYIEKQLNELQILTVLGQKIL